MSVNQQFIHPNMLKMSLACSRCENLVNMTCDEENIITIECTHNKFSDRYEEIAKITRMCLNYKEDLDILRQTLNKQ